MLRGEGEREEVYQVMVMMRRRDLKRVERESQCRGKRI